MTPEQSALIFNELAAPYLGHPCRRAPFRHSDGTRCYGCQSCLANAYEEEGEGDGEK